MKRLEPEIIDYYNGEVVQTIVDKYGYSQMDALREFVMWEAEKITGDPRNSIYIRGE